MAKRRANTEKTELKDPGMSDPKTGSSGSSPLTDTPTLGSSPTPAAAEKAAKAKAEAGKKRPAEPLAPKPVVTLRVFQTLSGVKPQQFAGFMRYATMEEMRPATIPEWKARYEAFRQRPTK